MQEPRFVPGLGTFADRYEAFIIDQWGVLHDGAKPYPGAVETVAELQRRDKRVLLLSNSGRRVTQNRERLRSLGFDLEGFADVVTSGEATWQLIEAARTHRGTGSGGAAYLLTHLRDMEVIQGLDLELVSDLADAEFIFASGLEHEQRLEESASPGRGRCWPAACR